MYGIYGLARGSGLLHMRGPFQVLGRQWLVPVLLRVGPCKLKVMYHFYICNVIMLLDQKQESWDWDWDWKFGSRYAFP
jgi:hypothetical protein